MKTTRLRVTIREVSPTVLRVIDVPADSTLPELHDLLQVAIGWTNSHLHRFDAGDTSYGMADVDPPEDELDEKQYRLRDLPSRFLYEYDFGDGWEHDVEVLGPGDESPGLRYGEGRCAPEDCGGPYGYMRLLEEGAELPEFDAEATDLLVRRTVGEVPESVRLLLELTTAGVKLTPGGRLPRVIVREMQQRRPTWHPLGQPAMREDDLQPLVELHGMLRDSGLLWLRRGVLRPTRAAAEDAEVVRRLGSWFEEKDAIYVISTTTVALVAALGPLELLDLAEQVHERLGWRWSYGDRQPLRVDHVAMAVAGLSNVLEGVDMLVDAGPTWAAGPSALTLLPRATALAAIWTQRDTPAAAASPRGS